jgi:hypothetical protein
MKKKSLLKLQRHPGLFDAVRVRAARTLREFDDLVTAPLHGFAGVDDYWTRASSKPWLSRIAVPTLLLNACNDPFLPAAALPQQNEISATMTAAFPETGGHVGFISGAFPGTLDWPAILAAAKNAGVQWYFIEDESDEVARQIPQSLYYLKNVKF